MDYEEIAIHTGFLSGLVLFWLLIAIVFGYIEIFIIMVIVFLFCLLYSYLVYKVIIKLKPLNKDLK